MIYMDLGPFLCTQYLDGLEQKLSVKDNSHLERSKASVTKATIAAVKVLMLQDIRLSLKGITSSTCIRLWLASDS